MTEEQSGQTPFRPTGQDDLAPSGQMARIQANVAAIETLQRVEEQQRAATPDEQAVLARWSSWGAVSEVFQESNSEFVETRARLRELLSGSEYEQAQATVRNAHFTDAALVEAIWQGVQGLGVGAGSRGWEPGCGSGTFLGLAPDRVSMVGVERDSVTAGIAGALYPQAQVRAESLVDTRYPEGYFDFVIGNVPFDDLRPADSVYNPKRLALHNYTLNKGGALLRDGGVVAAVTSRYTMDSRDSTARKALQEWGDFLGAVRLPAGAHRRAAGTDVVTDVVFFQRRSDGREPDEDASWTDVRHERFDGVESVPVNEYFVQHPEQVVGSHQVVSGRFGPELTVTADPGQDTAEAVRAAIERIVSHAHAAGQVVPPVDEAQRSAVDARLERMRAAEALFGDDLARFEGAITEPSPGQFQTVRGGELVDHTCPKTQVAELSSLVGMRENYQRLLAAERDPQASDDDVESQRGQLRSRYEQYVARWGSPNRVNTASNGSKRRPEQGGFPLDPYAAGVLALERYDPTTNTAEPAKILYERINRPRAQRFHADTPADALALSRDTYDEVRLEFIADLLGAESADQAREQLGNLVFDDPDSGRLVPHDQYLSGDVRAKLEAAQAATYQDPEDAERFAANVAALREVLPQEKQAGDINPRLGSPWISAEHVEQFLRELLNDSNIRVRRSVGADWSVKSLSGFAADEANLQWYGTQRRSALKLTERLLRNETLLVRTGADKDETPAQRRARRKTDADESDAAQAKADELQRRFADWVWSDPDRTQDLVARYNRLFNSYVPPNGSGAHQSMPGLSDFYTPRPHQLAAVERGKHHPMLFDHAVGFGKTLEMLMLASEVKRLGMANKPVLVVPNNRVQATRVDAARAYPNAQVITVDRQDWDRGSGADASSANHARLIALIANTDADMVILPYSVFSRIPLSASSQKRFIDAETRAFRTKIAEASADGDKETVKHIEGAMSKYDTRLRRSLRKAGRPGLCFEDTGMDHIIVDELHNFANDELATNNQELALKGSARAMHLRMAVTDLRERTGRYNVVTGATGTPIPNSMSQAYVTQRLIHPQGLTDAGLEDFDSYVGHFMEVTVNAEVTVTNEIKMKERIGQFRNLADFTRMWQAMADVQTSDDITLPGPDLAGGAAELLKVEPDEQDRRFNQDLVRRAEMVEAGMVEPNEDNRLAISQAGLAYALDPRLVGWPAKPPGTSKLEHAADLIAKTVHADADTVYGDPYTGEDSPTPGGLVLVFADKGTANSDARRAGRFIAYDALADYLVDRNIPRGAIRFIQDYEKSADKEHLITEARQGQVSVIIGSTDALGTAVNGLQERGLMTMHLDGSWKPASIEQRNGRILREGNQNTTVREVRAVLEESADAFQWETFARKAKFILQARTGRSDGTTTEGDLDKEYLTASEFKAVASGNPLLLQKVEVDRQVSKLEADEEAFLRTRRQQQHLLDRAERDTAAADAAVEAVDAALQHRVPTRGDDFRMQTGSGTVLTSRAEAAEALRSETGQIRAKFGNPEETVSRVVAHLGGLEVQLHFGGNISRRKVAFTVGDLSQTVVSDELGPLLNAEKPPVGLVTRIENQLARLDNLRTQEAENAQRVREKIERAREEVHHEYPRAAELASARTKQADLDAQINAEAVPAETTLDEATTADEVLSSLAQSLDELSREHDLNLDDADKNALARHVRDVLTSTEVGEVAVTQYNAADVVNMALNSTFDRSVHDQPYGESAGLVQRIHEAAGYQQALVQTIAEHAGVLHTLPDEEGSAGDGLPDSAHDPELAAMVAHDAAAMSRQLGGHVSIHPASARASQSAAAAGGGNGAREVNSPEQLAAAYLRLLDDETVAESVRSSMENVLAHADPRSPEQQGDVPQPDPGRLLVVDARVGAVARDHQHGWSFFAVGTGADIPVGLVLAQKQVARDHFPRTRQQAQRVAELLAELADEDGTPAPFDAGDNTWVRSWRDGQGRDLRGAVTEYVVARYLATTDQDVSAPEQEAPQHKSQAAPPDRQTSVASSGSSGASDGASSTDPEPAGDRSAQPGGAKNSSSSSAAPSDRAEPQGEVIGTHVQADGSTHGFAVPLVPDTAPTGTEGASDASGGSESAALRPAQPDESTTGPIADNVASLLAAHGVSLSETDQSALVQHLQAELADPVLAQMARVNAFDQYSETNVLSQRLDDRFVDAVENSLFGESPQMGLLVIDHSELREQLTAWFAQYSYRVLDGGSEVPRRRTSSASTEQDGALEAEEAPELAGAQQDNTVESTVVHEVERSSTPASRTEGDDEDTAAAGGTSEAQEEDTAWWEAVAARGTMPTDALGAAIDWPWHETGLTRNSLHRMFGYVQRSMTARAAHPLEQQAWDSARAVIDAPSMRGLRHTVDTLLAGHDLSDPAVRAQRRACASLMGTVASRLRSCGWTWVAEPDGRQLRVVDAVTACAEIAEAAVYDADPDRLQAGQATQRVHVEQQWSTAPLRTGQRSHQRDTQTPVAVPQPGAAADRALVASRYRLHAWPVLERYALAESQDELQQAFETLSGPAPDSRAVTTAALLREIAAGHADAGYMQVLRDRLVRQDPTLPQFAGRVALPTGEVVQIQHRTTGTDGIVHLSGMDPGGQEHTRSVPAWAAIDRETGAVELLPEGPDLRQQLQECASVLPGQTRQEAVATVQAAVHLIGQTLPEQHRERTVALAQWMVQMDPEDQTWASRHYATHVPQTQRDQDEAMLGDVWDAAASVTEPDEGLRPAARAVNKLHDPDRAVRTAREIADAHRASYDRTVPASSADPVAAVQTFITDRDVPAQPLATLLADRALNAEREQALSDLSGPRMLDEEKVRLAAAWAGVPANPRSSVSTEAAARGVHRWQNQDPAHPLVLVGRRVTVPRAHSSRKADDAGKDATGVLTAVDPTFLGQGQRRSPGYRLRLGEGNDQQQVYVAAADVAVVDEEAEHEIACFARYGPLPTLAPQTKETEAVHQESQSAAVLENEVANAATNSAASKEESPSDAVRPSTEHASAKQFPEPSGSGDVSAAEPPPSRDGESPARSEAPAGEQWRTLRSIRPLLDAQRMQAVLDTAQAHTDDGFTTEHGSSLGRWDSLAPYVSNENQTGAPVWWRGLRVRVSQEFAGGRHRAFLAPGGEQETDIGVRLDSHWLEPRWGTAAVRDGLQRWLNTLPAEIEEARTEKDAEQADTQHPAQIKTSAATSGTTEGEQPSSPTQVDSETTQQQPTAATGTFQNLNFLRGDTSPIELGKLIRSLRLEATRHLPSAARAALAAAGRLYDAERGPSSPAAEATDFAGGNESNNLGAVAGHLDELAQVLDDAAWQGQRLRDTAILVRAFSADEPVTHAVLQAHRLYNRVSDTEIARVRALEPSRRRFASTLLPPYGGPMDEHAAKVVRDQLYGGSPYILDPADRARAEITNGCGADTAYGLVGWTRATRQRAAEDSEMGRLVRDLDVSGVVERCDDIADRMAEHLDVTLPDRSRGPLPDRQPAAEDNARATSSPAGDGQNHERQSPAAGSPTEGIVISHGRSGTTVSSPPDDEAVHNALRTNKFRWSKRQQFWYLPRPWSKDTRDFRVDRLAEDLGRLNRSYTQHRPDEEPAETELPDPLSELSAEAEPFTDRSQIRDAESWAYKAFRDAFETTAGRRRMLGSDHPEGAALDNTSHSLLHPGNNTFEQRLSLLATWAQQARLFSEALTAEHVRAPKLREHIDALVQRTHELASRLQATGTLTPGHAPNETAVRHVRTPAERSEPTNTASEAQQEVETAGNSSRSSDLEAAAAETTSPNTSSHTTADTEEQLPDGQREDAAPGLFDVAKTAPRRFPGLPPADHLAAELRDRLPDRPPSGVKMARVNDLLERIRAARPDWERQLVPASRQVLDLHVNFTATPPWRRGVDTRHNWSSGNEELEHRLRMVEAIGVLLDEHGLGEEHTVRHPDHELGETLRGAVAAYVAGARDEPKPTSNDGPTGSVEQDQNTTTSPTPAPDSATDDVEMAGAEATPEAEHLDASDTPQPTPEASLSGEQPASPESTEAPVARGYDQSQHDTADSQADGPVLTGALLRPDLTAAERDQHQALERARTIDQLPSAADRPASLWHPAVPLQQLRAWSETYELDFAITHAGGRAFVTLTEPGASTMPVVSAEAGRDHVVMAGALQVEPANLAESLLQRYRAAFPREWFTTGVAEVADGPRRLAQLVAPALSNTESSQQLYTRITEALAADDREAALYSVEHAAGELIPSPERFATLAQAVVDHGPRYAQAPLSQNDPGRYVIEGHLAKNTEGISWREKEFVYELAGRLRPQLLHDAPAEIGVEQQRARAAHIAGNERAHEWADLAEQSVNDGNHEQAWALLDAIEIVSPWNDDAVEDHRTAIRTAEQHEDSSAEALPPEENEAVAEETADESTVTDTVVTAGKEAALPASETPTSPPDIGQADLFEGYVPEPTSARPSTSGAASHGEQEESENPAPEQDEREKPSAAEGREPESAQADTETAAPGASLADESDNADQDGQVPDEGASSPTDAADSDGEGAGDPATTSPDTGRDESQLPEQPTEQEQEPSDTDFDAPSDETADEFGVEVPVFPSAFSDASEPGAIPRNESDPVADPEHDDADTQAVTEGGTVTADELGTYLLRNGWSAQPSEHADTHVFARVGAAGQQHELLLPAGPEQSDAATLLDAVSILEAIEQRTSEDIVADAHAAVVVEDSEKHPEAAPDSPDEDRAQEPPTSLPDGEGSGQVTADTSTSQDVPNEGDTVMDSDDVTSANNGTAGTLVQTEDVPGGVVVDQDRVIIAGQDVTTAPERVQTARAASSTPPETVPPNSATSHTVPPSSEDEPVSTEPADERDAAEPQQQTGAMTTTPSMSDEPTTTETTSEPDMVVPELRAVEPDEVVHYLTQAGWTEAGRPQQRNTREFTQPAGQLRVAVPTDQDQDDYPDRLDEVLTTLENADAAPGRDRAGILRAISQQKQRCAEVNAATAEWFAQQLDADNEAAQNVRTTLLERLGNRSEAPATIRSQFAVGYAPQSWTGLVEHLRSHTNSDGTRRFTDGELVAAGVVGRSQRTGRLYDQFQDRLMVGIHDDQGRLAGFTGRDLSRRSDKSSPHYQDGHPKYRNTRATVLFQKRSLLFGAYEQRHQFDRGHVVLTEGPMDVLSIAAAAETTGPATTPVHAVAPCGTSVTDEHLTQVVALAPGEDQAVITALDSDAAGHDAEQKVITNLTQQHHQPWATRFPAGTKDPAEWGEKTHEALAIYDDPDHTVHAVAALVRAELAKWPAERLYGDATNEIQPEVDTQVRAAQSVARVLAQFDWSSGPHARQVQKQAIETGTLLLHEPLRMFEMISEARNPAASEPAPQEPDQSTATTPDEAPATAGDNDDPAAQTSADSTAAPPPPAPGSPGSASEPDPPATDDTESADTTSPRGTTTAPQEQPASTDRISAPAGPRAVHHSRQYGTVLLGTRPHDGTGSALGFARLSGKPIGAWQWDAAYAQPDGTVGAWRIPRTEGHIAPEQAARILRATTAALHDHGVDAVLDVPANEATDAARALLTTSAPAEDTATEPELSETVRASLARDWIARPPSRSEADLWNSRSATAAEENRHTRVDIMQLDDGRALLRASGTRRGHSVELHATFDNPERAEAVSGRLLNNAYGLADVARRATTLGQARATVDGQTLRPGVTPTQLRYMLSDRSAPHGRSAGPSSKRGQAASTTSKALGNHGLGRRGGRTRTATPQQQPTQPAQPTTPKPRTNTTPQHDTTSPNRGR